MKMRSRSGDMSDWYVPSIINVWAKNSEPRLYGNWETDLLLKKKKIFNKVSKPIKRGWYQVTHAWLTSTYHDQCGPSMVCLGYMVVEKLIWPQKLDIVVATARKATPMSRLQQLSLQVRQKLWDIYIRKILIILLSFHYSFLLPCKNCMWWPWNEQSS